MKKTILTLAAATFITSISLMSCDSPAQKVENAENKVSDANEDLNKANEEYLADVEKYKKETADRIEANNKSIAEFKARKALEKKEAREAYNDKIYSLEQKNSDMKKRLDEYKAEGKDSWSKFKEEFSRDMEELGKAFKDLTVTNTK